ncbi:efflux RND transporter periplasmic adaptor subunit [Marinobacter lipolyticus]|uniref:efflux RND transporter periplasmic adaptor subunit n=1 Tax=Marinobacter lipolyticus TaxID=209639 RepID=UPI003A92F5F3
MKPNRQIKLIHALLLSLSLIGATAQAADADAHSDHEHELPTVEIAEEMHAEEGHAEEEHSEEEHAEEEHADSVVIEPGMARQAGMTIALASTGIIREAITVYGRTTMNPQGVSEVRARFPGLVVAINPEVGDLVVAGEMIAEIESNESLQRYRIQSPIDGRVVSRNSNPGETTGDQPLLTIINYDLLWAELTIFPSNARRIQPGQEVIMEADGELMKGSISHILPGSSESPAVLARVTLDNSDGRWSPGLLLQADIIIGQTEVALAVDNRAIQSFEDNTVVFVQEGDTYESRTVELGRKDAEQTEILSGLEPGELYVVENSYLIKADLEKSSAEHAH